MQQHRVPFRLLRASVITGVVLSLAGTAHLAGGGVLPSPGILAALAALTMLGVTIAARRRSSIPGLAAILGLGQLTLHQAFETTTAAAACAPSVTEGPASHLSHIAGSVNSISCQGGADVLMAHPGVMGPAMLAAHALATLATAVVIAKGEAALWAMAAWLRPLLDLPVPVALLPRQRPAPAIAAAPAVQPGQFLSVRTLRGPPPATFH
jgi:hypothetical protein